MLLKARLPEGVEGIRRLHAMIAERLGSEAGLEQVLIETDRGSWVAALVTADYRVFVVTRAADVPVP